MSERNSDDEYEGTNEPERGMDEPERGMDDERDSGRDPNVTGDRDAGERGMTDGPATTADAGPTHDDPTTGTDPNVTGGFDTNPGGRDKWISAVIGLLGVWMILEAFLFDLVAGQFWNDLIVGALLLAAGAYNYYRRADERLGNIGAASLAALLGLWLIAAPFVFGAGEAASDLGFWNDIVVGLLALVLGAYSAYRGRSRRQATARAA